MYREGKQLRGEDQFGNEREKDIFNPLIINGPIKPGGNISHRRNEDSNPSMIEMQFKRRFTGS